MSDWSRAHREVTLETEICDHLASNGWLYSADDQGYDKHLALFPEDVLTWISESQPEEYKKLFREADSESRRQSTREELLKRLSNVLNNDPFRNGGTLRILREGFSFVPLHGGSVKIDMAQFRPATSRNPVTLRNYDRMRVRVMRQVHYSTRFPRKSLDLVMFINGIPVSTIEVKTDFTQSALHAQEQYRFDRSPIGEPLFSFGRRSLIHFALSNSEVWMTTKLSGKETKFLPFNIGNDEGAGNPVNPDGSATSYLWTDVLQKDSWLHIFGSFVHTQVETEIDPDSGTRTRIEKILFPRFHQWRAVTRAVKAARLEGPGNRYLIQHSAGSGKTNSISWLAHQLSQLHDSHNRKVFDTVVVVTDRTVLDDQLQDAISQFEKYTGVVSSIRGTSGDSKSAELAEALEDRKQIVIVTIQTFEALINSIQVKPELSGRSYAVIADEAHSSQTGSTAGALTRVLSPQEQAAVLEGATIDTESYLQWAMEVTANAQNISYFAFTATPKAKTLELFGRIPDGSTLPEPFDLYSMQQAIEEGFILDVLQNYTPYRVAWQLQHPGDDYDSVEEVDESTAVKALVQYVRLHPTNISQKAKIVVDHFCAFVQHELEGRAKAMVVTGSRKEAVRWKKYLDRYLLDSEIEGVSALVAFSGTVDDPDDVGEGLTERTQNPGLFVANLAEAFKTSAYNVMIVAEKFQTGFDQPKLMAMYVDKRLAGVQAVQTLSRLNRTFPGKDKTYVLDFQNEALDILSAFLPYYRKASLTASTDPNIIYDLASKLDSSGLYTMDEVRQAFEAAINGGVAANSLVTAATASCVERFSRKWIDAVVEEDKNTQDELRLFKSDVAQFIKLYDFLSQMRNFEDSDLPRRQYFFRRILSQLSTATYEEPVDISEIRLSEYKITTSGQAEIKLGEGHGLNPISAIGSGTLHERHRSPLSDIVVKLNERFGENYAPGTVDLTVTHILGKLAGNEELARQAKVNTPQQFAESPALSRAFMKAMVEVRDETPQLVNDLLGDGDVIAELSKSLPSMLYEFLRSKHNQRL